jgi:GT2 family glycosyltransferase
MSGFTFWASALLIAYTYVLFPLLVVVRGLRRPRPFAAARIEPSVSILIAARNEEATIAEKLANLAALDYPRDRLEVIIASDGSTDRTVDVVSRFVSDSERTIDVRLLDLPPSGKATAITAAVVASRGEILVFSDANSMYAQDAIRALVPPFADASVGGVAGNQVYAVAGSGEAAGERGYWSYDRLLKEFESRAGSTIGGTGAIYAIRRALFRPIPAGVNDDFYESAGVVDQGFRLVFAPDAVAFEPPAVHLDDEYGRKVRVISRAMRCVAAMPGLLDPRRHGFYAVQLLSHKVLRWAMALPLGTLFASTALLATHSAGFRLAFGAQAVAYALAAVGTVAGGTRLGRSPVVSVPAYFVMVNLAALRAGWNLVTGRTIDQWRPNRPETLVAGAAAGDAVALVPVAPAAGAAAGAEVEAEEAAG